MSPLAIGVVCHPGLGGSGVVAMDLAVALARRGHAVHVVATQAPARQVAHPNLHLHVAATRDYPVFDAPPYPLALCTALSQLVAAERLDLLHAHYAVPHAVVAWMAREVAPGPRLVTTLHGTDVTVLGDAYHPIVQHALQRCDAVTAPSRFLRDAARARFELAAPVEVIPNFVDTEAFAPLDGPRALTRAVFGNDDPVLVHVSNFRPVKRVQAVLDVYERVLARRPANLLMIGEGPDRREALARAQRHGGRVHFTGRVDAVGPWLRECAVFLFPSRTESFGLAALEALASGVPVVASRVGGVPEVVEDGVSGRLVAVDDVPGMAQAALDLLAGDFAAAARASALRFAESAAVDAYEALYRRALSGRRTDPGS